MGGDTHRILKYWSTPRAYSCFTKIASVAECTRASCGCACAVQHSAQRTTCPPSFSFAHTLSETIYRIISNKGRPFLTGKVLQNEGSTYIRYHQSSTSIRHLSPRGGRPPPFRRRFALRQHVALIFTLIITSK